VAKNKDVHDPASVTAYIEQLPTELRPVVEAVRQYLLPLHPNLGEQIKWNSPSIFYTGAMEAFDPKTYQRDLVVMHLRKGYVLLVLPTGERVKDISPILEGAYTDGRRMVTIKDLSDLEQKQDELKKVILALITSINSTE